MMGKSCYICKHSKSVKYIKRYKYDKQKYKKEELFCIAVPPGPKNIFNWDYICKGRDKLIRHSRYPVVSNVVPCSLYFLTNNKKKIDKYNIQLEKEKQKREEIKIKEQKIKEDKKKEKIQKKIKLEKEKVEKEKIKQEK